MAELTQAELKHLLSYDPETGVFHWINPPGTKMRPGDRAGSSDSHGYRQLKVNGMTVREHRMAWLYVYGFLPDGDIDHINGNGLDNRIINLRDATHKQNLENQTLSRKNTSGYRGVVWRKDLRKWKAQIKHHGVNYSLGLFDSLDEASSVAKGARDTLFTHHHTTHSA